MKKSYVPNKAGYYMVNNNSSYLTTSDIVWMSDAEYGRRPSEFTETADWKTIATTNVPTTGGDVAVTKTLSGISTEKIITLNLAITTGNMDAGTTVQALVKNSAGDTVETINYTFGAINADANQNFIFKPAGLLKGNSIEFTITLKDSSATYDADIVITPSALSDAEDGVLFTVGTATATNPAQVDCVIVDADGDAITESSVVDVFITDTSFAPTTVSTLAVATNGASLGDVTANQALVALSKADGTLRVNVTNTAGTVYLHVRLKNGKVYNCPVIHTA